MPRRPLFLGARLRRTLARHPWIRWILVTALAAVAGWGTLARVQALDASRARWDDGVEVAMLRVPVAAGERIDPAQVVIRTLPPDAVPDGALSSVPSVATARRALSALVALQTGDLGEGPAPGALVVPGTAGVAVLVPADQRPPLAVGDSVGLVLTADPIGGEPDSGGSLLGTATVLDVAPTVVVVGVPDEQAPDVAAAAASARISLVLLAEGADRT